MCIDGLLSGVLSVVLVSNCKLWYQYKALLPSLHQLMLSIFTVHVCADLFTLVSKERVIQTPQKLSGSPVTEREKHTSHKRAEHTEAAPYAVLFYTHTVSCCQWDLHGDNTSCHAIVYE